MKETENISETKAIKPKIRLEEVTLMRTILALLIVFMHFFYAFKEVGYHHNLIRIHLRPVLAHPNQVQPSKAFLTACELSANKKITNNYMSPALQPTNKNPLP